MSSAIGNSESAADMRRQQLEDTNLALSIARRRYSPASVHGGNIQSRIGERPRHSCGREPPMTAQEVETFIGVGTVTGGHRASSTGRICHEPAGTLG
jgi:hypothetical protein